MKHGREADEVALDFAAKELEFCEETGSYDEQYRREIRGGIEAWKELMDIAGFDLEGVFRRRALTPFVRVPRHVSNRYGANDLLSLMSRLRQAQEAFVYGVPLAAFALMRVVLDLVLTNHYTAAGKDLGRFRPA